MKRPYAQSCDAASLASLTPSARELLWKHWSASALAELGADWWVWSRPSQRPPECDWRDWLFLGGRGAGKTRAGSEWVSFLARTGAAKRIALVGPTFHDVREVMIEGASGLRALPHRDRPAYEPSRRRLIWPNGAQAFGFSAEDVDGMRGPQFDAAWCDELCHWKSPGAALQVLAHALRMGETPLMLVTSTPKPSAALKMLLADSGTAVTRASTFENRANLAPGFIASLEERWSGSAHERQELLGELLEDHEGALWTRALIEAARTGAWRQPDRVIVVVDPPAGVGKGANACGIIAAGRFEVNGQSRVHMQGSTEGASIPTLYGRMRIAGQVIWAARFKEHVETSESAGGKGGPRVRHTDYRYTLSFAVGLCEGEITRIDRVWANGQPLDLSQYNWRLHRGGETQAPDPAIEAIEGGEEAPAYRGLAYVVFEDMPLDAFGDSVPQLSFEVVRATPSAQPRLEDMVRGVCLIPGSGEFVYATEPVRRVLGPGEESAENVHAVNGRANLMVSLDQLAADLPNCDSVLLVVSWFGDDLRCGECRIRPGVEIAAKETTPQIWRAGGVAREDAHIVSQIDDAPAFGGTPSDASVVQVIAELKARGYSVGLYPFLQMDIPSGNALPDPYGGAAQVAYPWRGRVSVHPAAGQPGTADKTSSATDQVAAFFGDAAPGEFGVSGGAVTYSGAADWRFRRFILHMAKLAELAGGVDAFVIGSEMRALTTARSSVTAFPAVTALRALASDVRAMLGPETILTYAADWSEYFGHQPQDGSGDVFFHLDPLWADSAIDVVGVDWYAPLTDWRDGGAHADAALSASVYDSDYLEGRIEAGENYDFFYASEAARSDQARSSISDGAYGEPWIYRAKDVRNFWSRLHYDRPGGVRALAPTNWAAQSKPFWFIELGCPAIDKGANAPNLFIDAKSAESAEPPFSSGLRDDLIQRRALEAYLRYWDASGANNPISAVTGARMLERSFAWCWDARPYPAYPSRGDVWTDGESWRRGHWLNGRAGLSGLAEVVADICARAGVEDVDVAGLEGAVSGYVIDAPASARAALEPLMAAYDFHASERDGRFVFAHRGDTADASLDEEAFPATGVSALYAERADGAEAAVEARVRFVDAGRDYLIANVSARRLDRAEGGVLSLDAPLALDAANAERIAQRALADARAKNEALQIELGPASLALEPGDRVTFGGGVFTIERTEDTGARAVSLRQARARAPVSLVAGEASPDPLVFAPAPDACVLDLPPLPGAEDDDRPLLAVYAAPWRGVHAIHAGPTLEAATLRGAATQPACMGALVWALWPGPVDRWDQGNRFRARLVGGAVASVSEEALLNGANAFALEGESGEWEIVQARDAVLVAPSEYEFSTLLRGRLGSAHAMRAPHPVGARIVKLDARLARFGVASHEWGDLLTFAAPPPGAGLSDPRTATLEGALPNAGRRAWAPAHVRARRMVSGDVAISWVRRAHKGGDTWAAGDAPLPMVEAYALDILDGSGAIIRSVAANEASFLYTAGAQVADFGSPPTSLRVRVAQLGESGATGLNTELTIPL